MIIALIWYNFLVFFLFKWTTKIDWNQFSIFIVLFFFSCFHPYRYVYTIDGHESQKQNWNTSWIVFVYVPTSCFYHCLWLCAWLFSVTNIRLHVKLIFFYNSNKRNVNEMLARNLIKLLNSTKQILVAY